MIRPGWISQNIDGVLKHIPSGPGSACFLGLAHLNILPGIKSPRTDFDPANGAIPQSAKARPVITEATVASTASREESVAGTHRS
jgi:hypothetical protein